MELDEYQEQAKQTFIPTKHHLERLTLGLTGEAGEAADLVKKRLRRDRVSDEEIQSELGDVLWYIALLADELNTSLDEIASANLHKLSQRDDNNTLRGTGHDR